MITGRFDFFCTTKCSELKEDWAKDGRSSASAECTYIVPSSTSLQFSTSSEEVNYIFNCLCSSNIPLQRDHTASVRCILGMFGYENLLDESNTSNINHLENVMTLSYDVYDKFDRFFLWLVPTVSPFSSLVVSGSTSYLIRTTLMSMNSKPQMMDL